MRHGLPGVAALVLIAILVASILTPMISLAKTSLPPSPLPGRKPPKEPSPVVPKPGTPVIVPNPSKSKERIRGEERGRGVVAVPARGEASGKGGEGYTSKIEVVTGSLNPAEIAKREEKARRAVEEEGVVKLITGDIVRFYKVNGSYRVVVKPAKEGSRFYVLSDGKRLYVIPTYVDTRRFDLELFDVTYLYKYYMKYGVLPLIVKVRESVPQRIVLEEYEKEVKGARGIAYTIIKAFSLRVPLISVEKVYRKLAADPRIEKVVLSKVRFVAEVRDDEYREMLYNSTRIVGAVDAWNLGFNGTGMRIAVLDTGIDPTHPDFYFPNGSSKIVANRSFVDYDWDGTPDEPVIDGHGHGTHCASIAAGTGRASNGTVTGVAPGALLIIGKVLSNAGWGFDDWVIAGIEWAVEQGADVISMSLGGAPTLGYDPLEDAVRNATAQGVVVVVAAGNEGPEYFTVSSPGTTPEAITVAAVDKGLNIAFFSSRGPTIKAWLKPDIAAPGVMIAAARANNTYMGPPASRYYVMASGTSMATPHVAGLVALLKQGAEERFSRVEELTNVSAPGLRVRDLKYMLLSYATWNPEMDIHAYGNGVANITGLAEAFSAFDLGFAYLEPEKQTVYSNESSTTVNAVFVCGVRNILDGWVANFTVEAYIAGFSGPGAQWIDWGAVRIEPEVVSFNCSGSQIVRVPIKLSLNWTAIASGYYALVLSLVPANNYSYNYYAGLAPHVGIGLYRLHKLTIRITGVDGFSGYLVAVPSYPYGYIPTVFGFDTTPVDIKVPVTIPGTAYALAVAASSSGGELLTTGMTHGTGLDIYLDPARDSTTITIDVGHMLKVGDLIEWSFEPPTAGFVASAVTAQAFIEYNGSEFARSVATASIYAFGSYVPLITHEAGHYRAPDNVTSPAVVPGIAVGYEVKPQLMAYWPEGDHTIRVYYCNGWRGMPWSTDEIVGAPANYTVDVALRRVGSGIAYISLIPGTGDLDVAISPEYGFDTPAKVRLLVSTRDVYLGYIQTPATIYVYHDDETIGFVSFEHPLLSYAWIDPESGYGYSDPLRAPLGTTVWYYWPALWKGIDGVPYLEMFYYVRFLDSWWVSQGMASAMAELYIDEEEVVTEYDDDPGVLLYGWKGIGGKNWTTIDTYAWAWLSWAAEYIDFYHQLYTSQHLRLEGTPESVPEGPPAYTMWEYPYVAIPGFGVSLILFDPLTMENFVPQNLTHEAVMLVEIRWLTPINTTTDVFNYTIELTDENGTTVYRFSDVEVESYPWLPEVVYLRAYFDPTTIPVGTYGIRITFTVYNKSLGGFKAPVLSYSYMAYPAVKLWSLFIKPIYVAPTIPPGNYTSLREAIEAAYPNQTIYVYPGNYTEGVLEIRKPLRIIGIVENGTMPFINASFYVGSVPLFEIANVRGVPYFRPDKGYRYIDAWDIYNVSVINVTISGDYSYFTYAIIIGEARNVVIRNVEIHGDGFTGIGVFNFNGAIRLFLENVTVDHLFRRPIALNTDPATIDELSAANTYVDEEGVLKPLKVVWIRNTDTAVFTGDELEEYNVMLFYNVTEVHISNATMKYLHLFTDLGSTYVENVLIAPLEGDRKAITMTNWNGVLTLYNVTTTPSISLGLNGGDVNVESCSISMYWGGVVGAHIYIADTSIGLGLSESEAGAFSGPFIMYVDYMATVVNSSIIGRIRAPAGLYVKQGGKIVVTETYFENLDYGIVLANVQGFVVKNNVFRDVTIPVVVLPKGSVPLTIWSYYPSDEYSLWLNELQSFFHSTSPSSGDDHDPSPSYVYSNSFLGCSVCLNITFYTNCSLFIANNTFISANSSSPFIVLSSLNTTFIWYNVFNGSAPLLFADNVSVVRMNFNDVFGGNETVVGNVSVADLRWNYLVSPLTIRFSGPGPGRLLVEPRYREPLALPLTSLVPGVVYRDGSVVDVGSSTSAELLWLNPYDTNVSVGYELRWTPGIRVSNSLTGNLSLLPLSSYGEGVRIEGVSPGEALLYVYMDGFRVWFPINVTRISVRLGASAPAEVLRGDRAPLTVTLSAVGNASIRGFLFIRLSSGLELWDPAEYRYASAVSLPVEVNSSVTTLRFNLTALHVGNASVELEFYVPGVPEPVNSTRLVLRTDPNPNVNFTLFSVVYPEEIEIGSFDVVEIGIEGDGRYTTFLNVTVESSNSSVLGLGYSGDRAVVSYLVRLDPDNPYAYLYVPMKGVGKGAATVTIRVVDVEDSKSVEYRFSIRVSPPIVWGHETYIAVLSTQNRTASIEVEYPATTVEASMYIYMYSSKVSTSYEALGNLMSVPWGCVEQTTSPLLADIELHRYIDRENLWSNVSEYVNRTLLENYIRKGADRLVNTHLRCNATMCWYGWYPELSPRIFYTTYGLIGLLRAYEFSQVWYPRYYGVPFDLGIDVQTLNRSVQKIVRYLVALQSDGAWRYPEEAYDYLVDETPLTSFAVYALARAYNLGLVDNRSEVLDALVKAVEWLESTQLRNGSWRANPDAQVGDPYTTGLVLLALAAANSTGIPVNTSVVKKAVEYLSATQHSLGYWAPVPNTWRSWWGLDIYTVTAHVVLGLNEVNATLRSYLPSATVSGIDSMIASGSRFLILTSDVWFEASTRSTAAILWAVNSVGVDLSFARPPTVVYKVFGDSSELLSGNYTFVSRYSYYSRSLDLEELGWLQRYKSYRVELSMASGEGEVIVIIDTWYGYYEESSSGNSTGTVARPGVEEKGGGRRVFIVIGSSRYEITQAPGGAGGAAVALSIEKSVDRAITRPGEAVRVTLKLSASQGVPNLVVEDPLPEGFRAVINTSALAAVGVAFDEDRYRESGGAIVSRDGDTVEVVGGILAFAIDSLGPAGLSIEYSLVPVNVSYGSRITLPGATVRMFYTPAGREMSASTPTTPTVTIGVVPRLSTFTELMFVREAFTNSSTVPWGNRIGIELELPRGLTLNASMTLLSEGGEVLLRKVFTNISGRATLWLDTLELAGNVTQVENSFVVVKLRLVYRNATVYSVAIKLFLPEATHVDLFKRMLESEIRYATNPEKRAELEQEVFRPIEAIWRSG